jgi:DNA (cytosine-5)-methyltransferase 1
LLEAIGRLRLKPIRDAGNLPGRPDFVFKRGRVAVFCDGDFWHGKNWDERKRKLGRGHNASYWVEKIETNRRRDRRVNRELRALGYKVVRLWESAIRADPEKAAERVRKALTGARNRRKKGVMVVAAGYSQARSALSLFTGAGGLDLGFEAAGFETRAAVELDSEAVATLRKNRDWKVLDKDIHSISTKSLLDEAGLHVGDVDVLIGGPPCQPFSKAGYWARGTTLRLDDPRAGTLEAYLRVLRDALPKTFLLENVPGLAYRGKSEGLDLIRRTIDEINRICRVNYSVSVAQLNAADFGVPQTRERVFVIGARDGRSFEFPEPTHFDPFGGSQLFGGEPYLTAWDAIGDLEHEESGLDIAARGKWSDLLPSIPEGENYLWHTARGGGEPLFGWRRRYWTFLLKLSKRRPAWTLQAQPGPAVGPFHWKSRRLSPHELCRLQTFPENYTILGALASAQKQLGNAVPAALAEVLARQIRLQLLGEIGVSPRPTLLPERRLPVPEPEPLLPVPEKYLHLRGEHSAHPGTGLGNAALRRPEVIRTSGDAAQLF